VQVSANSFVIWKTVPCGRTNNDKTPEKLILKTNKNSCVLWVIFTQFEFMVLNMRLLFYGTHGRNTSSQYGTVFEMSIFVWRVQPKSTDTDRAGSADLAPEQFADAYEETPHPLF